MKILHLFSGYNTFTTAAEARGHEVVSLDVKNYPNAPQSTIICDFMDFDYKSYTRITFDFLLIGFPCTTFSKASGHFHFKNNKPQTKQAEKAIQMINRLQEIINYFQCDFLIENPTSALFSNYHFISKFNIKNYNLIRLHQYVYGHELHKQTDLLTSKNYVWLISRIYRVNGKQSTILIDNISLRRRQSYPPAFCHAIIDFMAIK